MNFFAFGALPISDRRFGRERPGEHFWAAKPHKHRGSIKGDVKKKHFSLRRKGTKFLTSRSGPATAIRSAASLGIFLFMLLVAPAGILAPASSVVAIRPTMVLSETRGLSLYWVVRGGIRSLVRLKA